MGYTITDFHAFAGAIGLIITLLAIAAIIAATVHVRRFDKTVKRLRANALEIANDRRCSLPGDTVPCPHRRLSDHFPDGNLYVLPDAATPWRRELQNDMRSRVKPR